MFYLTNNEVNTFVLYTGRVLTTCNVRYTDLATMTERTAALAVTFQNDRYAELSWDVSAEAGQYIVEVIVAGERVVTHVAYIADAADPIENGYTYYD
jgi:hypothetical protein